MRTLRYRYMDCTQMALVTKNYNFLSSPYNEDDLVTGCQYDETLV